MIHNTSRLQVMITKRLSKFLNTIELAAYATIKSRSYKKVWKCQKKRLTAEEALRFMMKLCLA